MIDFSRIYLYLNFTRDDGEGEVVSMSKGHNIHFSRPAYYAKCVVLSTKQRYTSITHAINIESIACRGFRALFF